MDPALALFFVFFYHALHIGNLHINGNFLSKRTFYSLHCVFWNLSMLLHVTHLSVCFINIHNMVNLLLLGFKLFPIFHSCKQWWVSSVLALRVLETIFSGPYIYEYFLIFLRWFLGIFGFTSCGPSSLSTAFSIPKSSSFLPTHVTCVGMGASVPLGRT